MKKTTIYHTVTCLDGCQDNYGLDLFPLYINGYIHHVFKRRLFGFIPLPDKYEIEIRVRDKAGHGEGLTDYYLRRELDAQSQFDLKKKIDAIREKLKSKCKEYI